MDIGTYVSLCHYQSIRVDKSRDFSETGKCNFYTTEETFFTTPQVMAFQVRKKGKPELDFEIAVDVVV